MKILFDNGTPRSIARVLTSHEVTRARQIIVGLILILDSSFAQQIQYEKDLARSGSIPITTDAGAIDLVSTSGGRIGKIVLRQTEEGLLILGSITGRVPHYARFPAEMGTREYVGVWLAVSNSVPMPVIGALSRFGPIDCQTPDQRPTTEDCLVWESRQVKYREQLRRLFVRHWELTPTVSVETYASDAYQNLTKFSNSFYLPRLRILEPRRAVLMKASASTFEIRINWSDFPPANRLNLSDISLVVDFVGPGGVLASTDLTQRDGNPATFRQLTLERPKVSRVSDCAHPLERIDVFRNTRPAWYFPNKDGHADDIFSLNNPMLSYQDLNEALSPLPAAKHHFSKAIGTSDSICGPDLRYISGKNLYSGLGDYVDEPGANFALDPMTVDGKTLEVRSDPSGGYLIKNELLGTYSPFGTGPNGSCLVASLIIYKLNPSSGISIRFRKELLLCNPALADFRVSPDWRSISVLTETFPPGLASTDRYWQSQLFCLSGETYKFCGEGPIEKLTLPTHVKWQQ